MSHMKWEKPSREVLGCTGVNFVVFDFTETLEAVEIPLLCDVRVKVCSQRKSTIESGQLGIIALGLSHPAGLLSSLGWNS